MEKVMDMLKEALKNKWILAGGIAAIVLIVVIVVILCVSCGADDNEEGGGKTSPSDYTTDATDNETADNDNDDETTGENEDVAGNDQTTDEGEEDVSSKETTTNSDNTAGGTSGGSSSGEEMTTQDTAGGNSTGSTGNNSAGNNSTGGTSSGVTATTDFGVIAPSGALTTTGSRVSVHDPSIEYDPVTKKWYIFGSHTSFASSSNLIRWTTFEKEGSSNSKYGAIFAKAGEWAALGGNGYDIKGNLWAPDVIYNKDMGKWCMYMSVNGNNFYSSIAMATADSITGPYTYKGTVVYSGFTTSAQAQKTDFSKVTGNNDVTRYVTGGWGTYGTNAIDPCVLYDKDGQLWMVYGSWFGGLFMIKLDNETGLRDYSYTYSLDTNAADGRASDPYLGQRVSGGFGGTGEGPYIVWDEKAGYYYMYVSYCGLNCTDGFSGYQMRLFRSKNIDGPYVDAVGNNALRVSGSDDQSVKGIKIMGNYRFSSLSTAEAGTGSQNGYRSPGHNSAIVDNEGNRYLIYHTRFNTNSEWHQVRVHQQFLNEDGWLVTAPYEYLGSRINESGYSETDIVGSYELINHGNEVTFNVVAPMLSTYVINLNADHTITGDYEGTWSQKAGTCYATITIDGVAYKGVFFKQYDESSSHKETMTFTVIGSNNIALWGSRTGGVIKAETGKQVAAYTFEDTSNLGKDTIGTVGAATINGCAGYSDATRGRVLSFDGASNYVQLSKAATDYDSYTIMMWYKSTADATWQRVFDLGHSSDSSMFFTVYAWEAGARFAQQINGDGEKQINGSGTALNTWTHVALTVNGSTKNATLYINGKRVGAVTLSALPEDYNGTKNYLGKSQYDDPYFKGYMDNVYIFDYALSSSEVESYMNK